jgi:phage tail sheath protein FI
MANLTYPGVYVEEIPSGVRPIQAAGTSTAAFIGQAEKGSLTDVVKIFNFTEFQNHYGSFLDGSKLAHAVYQFFNNGGTQCYIVRVAGENTATANIVLNDRGTTSQASLTISAISPGVWGNKLAVVIKDGTNDPGNEFNLYVYWENELTPLEKFENLSMVPDAANFVEKVTFSSKYIRVSVNAGNSNVQKGTSQGTATPDVPLNVPGKTKFRININADGYQEVNLADAIGSGTGQVADLSDADKVASAIVYVVSHLIKLRASTDQNAFTLFTCAPDTATGKLVLTSGVGSLLSSVNVAPASNSGEDASGLLKLGKLNGGIETLGAAVTRPQTNPAGTSPTNYFLIGDNNAPTSEVRSVLAGSDGDPITNDQPYIDAFTRLNNIDDVSLIAVPGIGSTTLVGEGINYCGTRRSLSDCFFIGDMDQDDDTIELADSFMAAITPKNSYGAIYLPWIKMVDPTGKSAEPILVPPSGFIAGLYAKTDAQRGVWKAPAGTGVGIGGATGLAVNFTDIQQGNLNPKNINCIRQFAGAGIVPWGSRTITSDPEYTYIPVRRMAIFLRVSIYRGIQWAVFEPNDEPLWSSLRLNITSFMMTLYRRGAFQGSTPSQAFFVKCDKETTTQDDINLGIVNVLVGFAPLKPAEFVVVKISQKAGQSS